MAKHLTSPVLSRELSYEAHSTLGKLPSARAMRRLAEGFNGLGTHQKRVVLHRAQVLGSLVAGSGSAVSIWPFYFRTSANTIGLRVWLGLVDTDYASASNPRVQVVVSDAGAGTPYSDTVYYNGRNPPSNNWEIFQRTTIASALIEGLSADTEYYTNITVSGGARVAWALAYEYANRHADDSVAGIVAAGKFSEEGPIYDADWQDVQEAAKEHWRHSGAHLLSWTPNYNRTGGPTVTAASYTNIIDGSSTTVTANTPGVTLATQYHGTTSRENAIPVKMAVYATRTVGEAALNLRITDGTNVVTLTGAANGSWSTVTGTLPGQVAKYDIQAHTTPDTTWRIESVCLWEHED